MIGMESQDGAMAIAEKTGFKNFISTGDKLFMSNGYTRANLERP